MAFDWALMLVGPLEVCVHMCVWSHQLANCKNQESKEWVCSSRGAEDPAGRIAPFLDLPFRPHQSPALPDSLPAWDSNGYSSRVFHSPGLHCRQWLRLTEVNYWQQKEMNPGITSVCRDFLKGGRYLHGMVRRGTLLVKEVWIRAVESLQGKMGWVVERTPL